MTYTPIPAGTINWDVPLNAALTDIDTRLTSTETNVADKVSKSGDTMTGTLFLEGTPSTNNALFARVPGDAVSRFKIDYAGMHEWGNGTATRDVTLSRPSPGQLRVTPSVNAATSTSVGGAFNVTNTASTGAGGVFYTEQGAPGGHLLVVRVNSGTFNQNGIFAQYNGTGHNVNISHSGTGANSSGLNVGSTNIDHSAVGISGVETAKGTIKVTHTGTGTDASASALSIDLAGTGTASQGIFMTGTNGGTTGNLLELRNGGTGPVFRVTSAGNLAFGSGTGSPDTTFSRTGAGALNLTGSLTATGQVTAGTDALRMPQGEWYPQDHGLESWTHNPYAAASSVIAVNGTVYVVGLRVRRSVTIDTIHWVVGTAGATPTAGQNFVGLYNSAGTRLQQTNVDASISSSGSKATAITATALTPGLYWVGFVFNAATPPTLLRGSSFESSPSINLPNASLRAAVAGTGATALPASFTPGSLTTTNCLTFFAAIAE